MKALRSLAVILPLALVAGCDDDVATPTPDTRPGVLLLIDGADQVALPGTPVATPIRVRVVDLDGAPQIGMRVAFAPAPGHGFVDSEFALTDADGEVRVGWTLGLTLGPQRLEARAPGVSPSPLLIGATGAVTAASPEDILGLLRDHPPNGPNPSITAEMTLRDMALTALDEVLSHDSARTSIAVRDFYLSMIGDVAAGLSAPLRGDLQLWTMYNHGFIVRTRDRIIAFDLVPGYTGGWPDALPREITDRIDVLFITHRHVDHYNEQLVQRVLLNRGSVVVPSDEPAFDHLGGPMVVRTRPGQRLDVGGLEVIAHGAMHTAPTRMYEVVLPDRFRIVHTGDNQTSAAMSYIPDVDLLLLNSWVNESGTAPIEEGISNCIAMMDPDRVVLGHIQELHHAAPGSGITSRISYREVLDVENTVSRTLNAVIPVLAWGERYVIGQ